MEAFKLMDEMEEIIRDSKTLPFSSGKIVIEADVFLDRLDRLRAILPEELDQAQKLLSNRDSIVQSAVSEAEFYMESSKGKVAQMIDENEITIAAQQKAEEIVEESRRSAEMIKNDADDYAYQVLSHMEMVLKKGISVIQQGKDEIHHPQED